MGGDEGGISVARSPAPRRPHTSQAPLRFYGLDSLAVKIRGGTCPMDLLESDRRLRENESVARQDPKTYEKSMLIDVFGTETSPLARSSLELPRLLADVPSPTLQSTTILDFYDRLNTFSGELLQDLKDIPGLLWAGGAVIGALTGPHPFGKSTNIKRALLFAKVLPNINSVTRLSGWGRGYLPAHFRTRGGRDVAQDLQGRSEKSGAHNQTQIARHTQQECRDVPKRVYMPRRRPSHTHVAPALQVTLTTPEVLSCGRS